MRKLAGRGCAVRGVEFPVTRVGKREPENAVGEGAFAEKFRAGVGAVGLEFECIRAARAVVNDDVAADRLDVYIVGIRPAIGRTAGASDARM